MCIQLITDNFMDVLSGRERYTAPLSCIQNTLMQFKKHSVPLDDLCDTGSGKRNAMHLKEKN